MSPLVTVFGLPLHPLVIHAVVVLLPLGAVLLIACVAWPRLRESFATASFALLTLGFALSMVAKLSGSALAERLGLPEEHAEWGDRTALVAFLLMIVSGAWWWIQRRAATYGATDRQEVVQKVLGGLGIALSLAVIVTTVLAGHSGAREVWEKRLAMAGATVSAVPVPGEAGEHEGEGDEGQPPAAAPTPSPTPSPSPSPSPTPTGPVYTMADVQEHNYRQSCWAAVDGGVYDLTNWIRQHPGGQTRILNLCGTDATSAFGGQHGTAERPNAQLASMRIGTLVS
ncbi:cytochrome b5-like heme/steroid binding domain-containing protein [Ammonicoccus fulvus]|uniref:Cytochrome b5-like heme/steroid binding domain-containing protein n=1 Tax=Ammonicoccus fulvus TaxID=3138240 RepID=A0ABZ3FIQ5_9ACTN